MVRIAKEPLLHRTRGHRAAYGIIIVGALGA
jgi:hypothetical protein